MVLHASTWATSQASLDSSRVARWSRIRLEGDYSIELRFPSHGRGCMLTQGLIIRGLWHPVKAATQMASSEKGIASDGRLGPH